MLKLRKIAVTGPLCSGKTTVCEFFKKHGFEVIYTDQIVHDLLHFDRNCIQQVKSLLGDDIESSGQIDRKKISRLVFNDNNKLDALEKILHPLVFQRVEALIENCGKKNNDKSFFVVEVPLLFEAGWNHYFDSIVLVTSSKDSCLARAEKKGMSLSEYEERSNRMIPINEKKAQAHFIVSNDETLNELEHQVINIVKQIK